MSNGKEIPPPDNEKNEPSEEAEIQSSADKEEANVINYAFDWFWF